MNDHARFGLRAVVGASLAAHGAQKLFGAFGGGGPEGTGQAFEEHMKLAPGRTMALMAGTAEFGSGVTTAVGLGGPIGPTTMAATMAVAGLTGHRGKPFFGQLGGPEMAVLYGVNGAYLALAGFGRDSLDAILGLRIPRWIAVPYAMAAATAAAVIARRARRAQDQAESQRVAEPAPANVEPHPTYRRAVGE